MNLDDLLEKWHVNAEAYKTAELGVGVQDFVNDVLTHPDLFALRKTPRKTAAQQTYVHDTEAGKHGRPDFVLYIGKNIVIPCEVKCLGHIAEGLKQLKRYQLDYAKEYGILTDGFEWRFYRAHSYQVLTIERILADPQAFATFWDNYLKPENYYAELFLPTGQGVLFDDPLGLNDAENRSIFFKDTSKIISNFRTKIKIEDHKTAIETAYAYLIQFIMYKVLVDNRFQKFENDYQLFRRQVVEAIRNKDLYNLVVFNIRNISEYIAKNIYRPFAEEQQAINEKLIAGLSRKLSIEDIAPWLDIIEFINKYDFANLQNEIFGFVYENYLKDLYGEKNMGQYFTDPAIVNYMLDELGYDEAMIRNSSDNISIIDPACGAGTFLYGAVDRIIRALDAKGTKEEATQIKDLVEKNVFGLDIAEFPLYLAELCILVDMLPLIVNDRFIQPVEHKLKLFKTRDSISEFLDTGISAQETPVDLFTHLKDVALDYNSFMRDNENLTEMLLSMQGSGQDRLRFDYVIGNPPYISYKDCSIQKVDFMKKIRERRLRMNDVFGVNLHSIPSNIKKYAPTPNLFAFFIALSFGLLKENGKVCLIIPQTVLTAEALDVIRYHLSQNVTIEKLITFEGNLFIGRGLRSNKTVSTSSLIFVAANKKPRAGHKIHVVNYHYYNEKQSGDFWLYLKSRNKSMKRILQKELLDNAHNWNFIKHAEIDGRFCEQYVANSEDIACYYRHSESKERYGSIFYFDRGLKYPKDKIKKNAAKSDDVLLIPARKKNRFSLNVTEKSIAKSLLDFPHGSQGLSVYQQRYKIVWAYMNCDRFRFSKDPIMIDYNDVLIASNHHSEMLYLLALLNANISDKIFNLYLFLENEQDLTIGIKSVKQYIRIPRITTKNQKLKDGIIAKTEAMLALEDVVLRDVVDFGRLKVQCFDEINVIGNKMVLTNSNDYRCKIQSGKAELVQKVIREACQKDGLFAEKKITLQELKTLPVIDFAQQKEFKKAIDDLVFALYFDVSVKDVAKHEFYDYVNSP